MATVGLKAISCPGAGACGRKLSAISCCCCCWAAAAAAAAATSALLLIFCFLSCETRCSGGWKYLHVSREHLPLTKSTHTVTSEFSVSRGQCAGGCA